MLDIENRVGVVDHDALRNPRQADIWAFVASILKYSHIDILQTLLVRDIAHEATQKRRVA